MRRTYLQLGAVIVGCLLCLAVAAPAFAFEVLKASNGVVVKRSATDTQTVRVYVMYGYTGGSNWVAGYDPFSPGAYSTYMSFGMAGDYDYLTLVAGAQNDTIEIPAPPSRCYLVNITTNEASPVAIDRFALLSEPLSVSQASTLPVSISSSISVDGTLPVAVSAIGDIDGGGLVAGAGLLLAGIGAMTYRSLVPRC